MRLITAEVWEQFLAGGNAAMLLAHIDAVPALSAPLDADYPEHHRLCDIDLEGRAFRITRLVEPELGRVRLFAEATSAPDYDRAGVPYELEGPKLLEWIRDEREDPTHGEGDWAKYLP